MGVISAEELNLLLDDVVQAYTKLVGTAGTGYGSGQPEGAFGAGLYLGNAYSRLGNSFNPDPILAFGRQARALRDGVDPETLIADKARAMVAGLDRHCKTYGGANYSSLETFLTYLNTGAGGDWAALQHPSWRTLYNAVKGGSNYPAAANLYFEILQGSTYANGLRSLLVGTGQTAGSSVDDTLYAGGVPCLKVSAFAGSSSTVTVTGTFRKTDGTLETSKTATFTVDGNGRFYRVAGSAGADALIVSVDTIVDTGGNLTASTLIYAEAERPALRSGTLGADTVTNSSAGLDDGASAVNDLYNALQIGTNADRYTLRTISDYDGNTKVTTISSTWATNPTASTSLFRVLRLAIA